MKKIKIGKYDVNVAETTADLSAIRFAHFKRFMIEDESGMELPKLAEMFEKFCNAFDRDSKSAMFLSVYEYMRNIKKMIDEYEPQQMMFALITTEENESNVEIDITFLKEKMKKYLNEGLNQQIMESEVINFITWLIER